MKKKIEKKFIINSSEWSKTTVSIIEANQTQQTVILGFYEKANLADYSLCVCQLSPLLGTPEKVSEFFFDFLPIDISENRKIYVIYSSEESDNSFDEEENILLTKKPAYPFNLKDDEAIGLLKKENDNVWKLVDWSKPIIDEIIPLEILHEVSQITPEPKTEFYKSKKSNKKEDTVIAEKKNAVSIFEKPLVWLLIFIFTISLFEIGSLVSLNDGLLFVIIKTAIIFLKNIFTGLFIFKLIRSGFKFTISLIFLLLLALACYAISYFLFVIGIFIGSALLILIVSIYSFLTKISK